MKPVRVKYISERISKMTMIEIEANIEEKILILAEVDMNQDIFELKMKGYCCSQIIMELGLKQLGKENPDLVSALIGLCNGLWNGKTCGIISAANCLFCLIDPNRATQYNIAAFGEWFEDVYGSLECDELMENNPMNKIRKCPAMLEGSFLKISEILEWD